ncbi:uncharacterized protein LOC126795735 [Argentina anserina]|uniref:uncharacterized protein LOC126795735 n=1 Tax=Argentina anserina TaxID=57926 RepID=UPI0021763501|nr:uncharacterized protein LOC126795735 [Potentilla anserina]
MYLDISATGQHVYVPSSGLPLPRSPKQGINEDFLESSGDSDEVQPEADGLSNRKGKKKSSTVEKGKGSAKKTGRVGGAALLAKKIDRMCEAIESRSTSSSMISKSAEDPNSSIKEVMKVVTSLLEGEPGSKLWFFATRLFLNQEKKEMFCTMEYPTIKLEWLKFEMSETYDIGLD